MVFLRSILTVSAFTGLSRILGFVRDICIASFLGSGPVADAFFIAFRIPNFFRRIFAEGAFSVAFVPVYSEYETQGGEARAKAFLDLMFGRLCLILLAVTAVGVIGAPVLVMILAPGFQGDPEKFQSTIDALRFTFPYLFFISLVAMAGGILNTRDRFLVPAVTPVLLNVCLIGAVFLLVPIYENAAVALGLGVLVAGVVQFGFQLPFLRLERRARLNTSGPSWTKQGAAQKIFLVARGYTGNKNSAKTTGYHPHCFC